MRKPSIWKKKKFKKLLVVFLIFFLSFWLIRPFLKSGYFPTHDGEWAVVRLGAMHRAIIAGHFPVRWAGNLNFSYGYPLFLFTYPLPYYLGEIFNLIGFGLIDSVKLLFILSVVFSGVSMYLLGKEIFGPAVAGLAGLIAAIFYLYSPFRLVDLYVRGSLGESLAFVFFPLLFLAIIKIGQGHKIWISLGAVFLAGLLLTHNVMALVFMPFLIIFCFLFRRYWRQLITFIILGFGLSAFFLLPALLEKNLIALSRQPLVDITSHFVSLKQLVMPGWGYGSPGSDNAFSFQLGWVHLGALIISLIIFLKNKNRFFVFCFVSLIVLIALMLPWFKFFWQKTPLFSQIDFPWRLLGPASFFLALSLGYLGKQARYLGIIMAAITILVNIGYAKPQKMINYPDDYYLTNEATTTSADELMPIWVKQKPVGRPASRVEVISGITEIGSVFENAKLTKFTAEVKTESEIQINTIYFPGWKVLIDGQPTLLTYSNSQGVIRFPVTPGQHQILAKFGETPLRLGADVISLTSFLILGSLVIKNRKK